MKAKKILLVDDDREFVQSNSDLLEANGYSVLKAYDGTSGLDVAVSEKPDLMILDVMMSYDSEGFDISRKIAKTEELKHMPVIIVTGVSGEKHLPFTFTPDKTWLPAEQVLNKPVKPGHLLDTIRKIIEKDKI